MLHRVDSIDKNRLFSNENMKVSPDYLEQFILDSKESGFEFISLDRLYEILINDEKITNQIALTLDDGYLDNYTNAYKIFTKHNTPFAIYVTTSFPKYEAILWWYALEDLILKNDEILLFDGSRFKCKTKEQKEKAFLDIRSIILRLSKDNLVVQLDKLFINYQVDWFSRNKELCLSWQNIIDLSKDSLCTIAGHTKSHLALNQLSRNEVLEETVQANYELEEKIGKKIEHFAYPFGTRNEIGEREFEIIKNLNFKTVTTTRLGTIYPEHKNHLEGLPRVMLTEGFKMENALKLKLIVSL